MGRKLLVLIALGMALAGPDVTPARAIGGCVVHEYGPPWRGCGHYDSDRLDCGYGRTCAYYGPPDPPPRHRWRPEPAWAPQKHPWRGYWREAETPPPLPVRKPNRAPVPTETAEGDSSEEAQHEQPARSEIAESEPDEDPSAATARRRAAAAGRIPARYQAAENTVGHTLSAIEQGARLYRERCASCHGAAGEGDGPRAQSAGPPMPSLPFTLGQDYSTDAYLLWTIMEGGDPFGTEKPGFADDLTTEQAWQIIAYMRAGFPARGPARPLRQSLETQSGNTPARAR